MLVKLHNFVLIVLEVEYGAVDRGIGTDDNPVPSADSKHRVTHFINQVFNLRTNSHINLTIVNKGLIKVIKI